MIQLGDAQTQKFEVHGFVPGRGFIARFYAGQSEAEAIERFKKDFPKGMVFWGALAPESQTGVGCSCSLEGVQLGLHTVKERTEALQMAQNAYDASLEHLRRGNLRRATENLGFLQAISALAQAEKEAGLVDQVDRMLWDLGPKLSEAWKAA